MRDWITLRTTVLDEIVRHDGLQHVDGLQNDNGPQHSSGLRTCAHCLDNTGTFKCLDCSEVTLYCQSCIVERHEHLPLHRIEVRLQALACPFP